MARPEKVTDAQITKALEGSGGVICHAAKSLGITRQWLSTRISASDELIEARASGKAEVLDAAESQLFKAVRLGKPWAIRFVLSRLGRDRGYGASLQVDGGAATGRVVVFLPDDGREKGSEPTGYGNGQAAQTQ